ncbi:AraC family transcriptional regulator [Aestuariicella sp. G3-2]|uniref:AraC family transcriptional regulator n=1 Tax=Pseudomaricurvus albidus TaxID=2842452 RepID=UPI001C0CEDA0|nr:AraC family transcriptional regulator [Aestuariicella albida]MBU3068849.1 AraC family transcriptional regulator [Aestuariicella albida]
MAASTLTSWALLLWEELRARQLDANALFQEAGLDSSKLSNNVARYTISQMQHLWGLALEKTSEDLGISVGLRWSPTTFHALGFAWLASSSLGDALYRAARYGKFVNDGIHYELVSERLQYRFSLHSVLEPGVVLTPASVDASLVALLKMIRMLLGEGYSPVEVHCPHPPNSAALLLERQARCPLLYGSDSLDIILDRMDVEKVLTTGNSELSLLNEKIITQHLSNLDQDNLVAKVELEIANQLPSGQLKEDSVAKVLNLSRRTLQRHLAEEGTSFASLLETKRKALAETYVRNHALAISEVAYLLGFSEQANFTRAFKRWYGQSPSEYRRAG